MAKAKKQEARQEGGSEAAKNPAAAKAPKAAKSAAAAPAEPNADAAAAATPAAPKPKRAAKAKTAPAAGAGRPESGSAPATADNGPRPAAAARPPAAAAAKPANPTPTPTPRPAFAGIDTSLAAKAAASFVANRDLIGGLSFGAPSTQAAAPSQPSAGTAPPAPRPEQKAESGSFKNLKQTLAQPGGALNKILGIPGGGGAGAKKAGLPFGATGNNTRNQAGSGSGNKFGVPRRSNG